MSNQITLGSLFDGIGGFPLCAELSGIVPIWAAEIDPACVAVTHLRFPNMIHYGDVMQINGAEIPPVDIITFGSPCQDLSVAGKRKGIKHKEKGDEETTRSGLFVEAVRIIYEMREATNGQYPKYIVWENVPGAFSSQSGRDFQAVLEEITKAHIPMPASGRWANAGVVRGSGICAAWRLLDAQYWGVHQRRKRIYLVGSFGNDSAAEILFKRDSVRRYLAPRRAERQDAPADTGAGVEICSLAFDARGNGDGLTAPTMTGDHNGHISDYTTVVCSAKGFPLGFRSENTRVYDEKATTICNGTRPGYCNGVLYTAGFKARNGAKARDIGYQEEMSPTITTDINEYVLYPYQAKNDGGTSLNYHGAVLQKIIEWIVRRLTPLECERLQGYPDGWTFLPKIEDMSDEDYELFKAAFLLDRQIRGKPVKRPLTKKRLIRWYNKLDCDGTRYRQLGNSLAIPCALRVLGYIADYIREERMV